MAKSFFLPFLDKAYLGVAISSVLSSLLTGYLFYRYLVINGSVWLAPVFLPIYYYTIIVAALNLVLSYIAYGKDKFLSYALNGLTIAVNIILVISLILNIINPNG